MRYLLPDHFVVIHDVKVIAATVASDPTKYSEAFVGKSNEEYCSWILDSEKWGGLLKINKLSFSYVYEYWL